MISPTGKFYTNIQLLTIIMCITHFVLETSSGSSSMDCKTKEFPKRCIKKTKTEPILQWSYNPRHDASAYLMSRKDIIDEASAEEMQYLKFIINGAKREVNEENTLQSKNIHSNHTLGAIIASLKLVPKLLIFYYKNNYLT